MDRTRGLYDRAKTIFPGGVQLLSKRPELYAPGLWPAYADRAKGCAVRDLDGRRWIDMSTNGISSCLLGFAHPEVVRSVVRAVRHGSMSSLNPPEEVELAEVLLSLHPWAARARLFRTGGETAAAAVRIARATTDRSAVAICGYHGWHDWYLAANLGDSDALRGVHLPGLQPWGVPRELRGTAFTFLFDDRKALERIVAEHGGRLAAIVMEPCRYQAPAPGFLEYARDAARSCGALLLFDEITIGWRLCLGGSHLSLGVAPDIAFFAKALGNGHPIGAVIGTEAAMEGAHRSFISSTYWTEAVGPAAALATLRVMRATDVPGRVAASGARVREAWRRLGTAHRLPVEVPDGFACSPHFRFDHARAEELRTLFTQLMLERGFLAGTAFSPTLAHTGRVLARYEEAVDAAFASIARALEQDRVGESLRGPVAQSGFRRLV
jgi:glutamate-1-semialdehyde 2,1-aminomutase